MKNTLSYDGYFQIKYFKENNNKKYFFFGVFFFKIGIKVT